MSFFKKTQKISKKIIFTSLSIMSLVALSTGIIADAQWPNTDENENCNDPSANKPCSSIVRLPGSDGVYGTENDEWRSNDRSLNIDSWYSYNIEDGNGLGSYQAGNNVRTQRMTPKANPDLRDGEGNMLFCASEMFYNINQGGNADGVNDPDGTPECNNQVRKALRGSLSTTNFPTITYGPALTSLVPDQVYRADFRIKVENIDPSVGQDQPIFLYSKIGTRNGGYFGVGNNFVYRNEIENNQYNTYSILFRKDPNVINDEFRVFTYDNADISVDTLTIVEIDEKMTWTYPARNYTNFLTQNQNVMDGEDVVRRCNKQGACLLAINSEDNRAGQWYSAKFNLRTENISASDNKTAVELSVENFSTGGVGTLNRATHIVTEMSNNYTQYELIYYKPNDAGVVDYRVRLTDDLTTGNLYIKDVTVDEIDPPASILQTYQSEFQRFLNSTIVQDGNTLAVSNSTSGIATFGPSVNSLPTTEVSGFGNYTAKFYIKNQGGIEHDRIMRLDVSNYNGYTISKNISTEIYNSAPVNADGYRTLEVDFQRLDLSGRMHFRVVNFHNGNELRMDRVEVVNR